MHARPGSLRVMTTRDATKGRPAGRVQRRHRSGQVRGGGASPPGGDRRHRATHATRAAAPVEPPRLVWWSDSEPSVRRLRAGRGFRYLDPAGRPAGAEVVARARRLAIPPAWREVRICPDPNGYLQATGRDARGRKQYRYHPRWREWREGAKFQHLVAFGEALPAIRARVEVDLRKPGLPREKMLALVVRLLDLTQVRVGSERYVRENRSYGLTTLTNRHATVEGSSIRLRFRGKSGRVHEIGLRDRRLAALLRRCRELPGRDLFEYIEDDGSVRAVRSEDVNDYLRETAGVDVTAKMFRTWAATVLACRTLRQAGPPPTAEREARQVVREASELVADRLGNTAAVARASYIHPAIPAAYLRGTLEPPEVPPEDGDLDGAAAWTQEDEAAALSVIRRWAAAPPLGRAAHRPRRASAER
jgi:DNA topoisomerase-1